MNSKVIEDTEKKEEDQIKVKSDSEDCVESYETQSHSEGAVVLIFH